MLCFDETEEFSFPSDQSVPDFKPAFTGLAKSCDELTRRILKSLSIALGKDPDFLGDMYTTAFSKDKTNYTTLRSLYYPPIKDDVAPEVVRLGQHTGLA